MFLMFKKYLGSSRNVPPQPNAIKGIPHHTPLSLEALRAHTAMHGKNEIILFYCQYVNY